MRCELKHLKHQISNCNVCAANLPLGPNPIFQAGSKARILIAGQAPGKKVHESGIAFADASGQRLRDWLGVDAAQFYTADLFAILPMGFCYPGKGKSGDLPPRSECAEHWRHALLDALPEIELTLLIGQYAQQWHLKKLQKQNLTTTVAAWQEYWPDTIPLPHPSPLNNIWLKKNPWFEQSLLPVLQQRIAEILSKC